jgi:hypothetical protein
VTRPRGEPGDLVEVVCGKALATLDLPALERAGITVVGFGTSASETVVVDPDSAHQRWLSELGVTAGFHESTRSGAIPTRHPATRTQTGLCCVTGKFVHYTVNEPQTGLPMIRFQVRPGSGSGKQDLSIRTH